VNTDATQRFDEAERLLGTAELDGAWPRCAAWLIRLGLEHALDGFWRQHDPALARITKRAQLFVLGRYVDAGTRHRAAALWSALSRAGHHHPYELAPTVSELWSWLAEGRAIAEALADRTVPARTTSH
jgi:hypothetical protein